MLKVLALSNELTRFYKKMIKDIVNVVEFLNIAKKRLQDLRKTRCEIFVGWCFAFYDSHGMLILMLDKSYFLGMSNVSL